MIKRFLPIVVLFSASLYAMGGHQVNYDEQFDEAEREIVNTDIESHVPAVRVDPLSNIKLESFTFQEKIVEKNGRKIKKNVVVKNVARGGSLVYINKILNDDSQVKNDIVVKNPMPKGTSYVKGSAVCVNSCIISYSTDGGDSLSLTEKEGEVYNYVEFHFKTLPPQRELRMGFKVVVK